MSDCSLLDELRWRGMLYQHTEGLAAALEGGTVTGYCGFDPTAPSLHVGNLVPVMGLVHLQRAGHRPVALVGGGTGLIGDPSGKATERPLATPEVIAENASRLRAQLEHFLDFGGARAASLRDNIEWLEPLGALAFMRDIGKHFTVNYMMAKESVRARLDGGISYTEFSYMLLQAADFLELYRRAGVTLQLGGSDQWGNITAGIELIRRAAGAEAHGLTLPLLTTAGGAKFGKTEAGAVWLDAARTSPYQFYQFWVHTDDQDVGRALRGFTLLPRAEIEALDAETAAHPERRLAQQALARDVTTRVHGAAETRAAMDVSALLFGRGDPAALSEEALGVLAREIPFVALEVSTPTDVGPRDADGAGALDVLPMFAATGLTKSNGEARRLLEQGGLWVNGRRLAAEDRYVRHDALLFGRYALLKRGARQYALVRLAPRA